MKRSKLEFFIGSNNTPAFTAYNSGWGRQPILLTRDDWDTPPAPTRITFDRPANTSGGAYIDKYASWPGKVLSVDLIVYGDDQYAMWQAFRSIRAIMLATDLIRVKRTMEFPDRGKKVEEWLEQASPTLAGSMEVESRKQWKYGLVFTSALRDTTDPVESAL